MMLAALVMLKAMYKKYWIELKRYAFNTISMLVSFYLLFLLIFLGVRTFAGGEAGFGASMGGIIVGFTVFYMVLYAYAELSWVLIQEAQQGTLEQLSMSPVGFGTVLMGRLTAALTFRTAVMAVFLVMMMASTGKWLRLDPLTLIPLIGLTILGVLGIGFVMGGLAIVFKQIQASFNLLQFVFVGLIAIPLDRFPEARYLPITWGSHLLRVSMVDGTSLSGFPLGDLTFLVLNSAFYFAVGFSVFKAFERTARNRGLLGHY